MYQGIMSIYQVFWEVALLFSVTFMIYILVRLVVVLFFRPLTFLDDL